MKRSARAATTARPQLAPPPGAGGVELADWAETTILVGALPHLSRTDLRGLLRITGDDDTDSEIDLLLTEVQRREAIVGERYPFIRDRSGLSPRASGSLLYEFLVLLSFSEHFRKKKPRLAAADRLFDNVVRDALRSYLGPSAAAVRFAWPSSGARPKAFPAAVTWLAGLMGLGEGIGAKRDDVKDGGMDVAGWRGFEDGRSAFPAVLLQATLQQESEWLSKATNVVTTKWLGWIDTGVLAVAGLAVPFAIAQSYAGWDDLRRTVALVLDRLRLVELLPTDHLASDREVSEWVTKERRALIDAAT